MVGQKYLARHKQASLSSASRRGFWTSLSSLSSQTGVHVWPEPWLALILLSTPPQVPTRANCQLR